jgi:hypothetical protein
MKQDQIEQYLSGKLGEADAQAFEAYCVANPEFARQVEYEQRLRAGMEEVARGSTAEFVRADNPLGMRFAIAASVLVLLGVALVGWRAWDTSYSRPVLAATADAGESHPLLRLAQVRGGTDLPALLDETMRVEIVGLFDSKYHYSVELVRRRDDIHIENVATLYGQRPTSPVTLEVTLHGMRVRPGIYLLRVRKQAAEEEPLEFEIVKS